MERREFLKRGVLAGVVLLSEPAFPYGLEKKVTDRLTNQPIKDAVLRFYSYPANELIEECTTDSNGIYEARTGIEPVLFRDIKLLIKEGRKVNYKKTLPESSGIVKGEITHPEYLDAVRYPGLKEDDFTISTIPKDFDIGFFDAWTRGGKKVLKRWDEQPTWNIKTTNAEDYQIKIVKDIINDDLCKFTNGFINNPVINETEEHKYDDKSVLVYWELEGDSYGNHEEKTENNLINSASTWFLKSNKLRRVYLRQLTQVLGFVNNGVSGMDFWTPEGYYTPQGLDCGKILYSMKAGNSSPDSDPVPN